MLRLGDEGRRHVALLAGLTGGGLQPTLLSPSPGAASEAALAGIVGLHGVEACWGGGLRTGEGGGLSAGAEAGEEMASPEGGASSG